MPIRSRETIIAPPIMAALAADMTVDGATEGDGVGGVGIGVD